jgi:YVTN family beta-propeller protein
MKTKFYWIAWVCVSALLFTACKREDETPDDQPPVVEDFATGAYVVNEGSFLQNNASITHISPSGTVTNDVYYAANGVELGDVLQSFTIIGDRGFAVLNNSQKVEVVDLKTMENVGTISGLSYPRYMVSAGTNKAYLTNGSFSGTLEVLNTQTLEVTSSIAVGTGPNQLLAVNDEVWVCNEGGFGLDSTISVVNTSTNTVVDIIEAEYRPSDIVKDALGNVWVLCAGETYYDLNWSVSGHSPAYLIRFDAETHAFMGGIQVGVLGDHPRQLEVSPDGTILYYENNGIYKYDLLNGDMPGNLIVNAARSGLSVHPSTGNVWCASISDFTNPSSVYEYSASGSLLKTYAAGIAASGVVFK